MDNELMEISASLPRREQESLDKDNAIRIAYQMKKRHGYWMALYHCTTLMIHCHKLGRDRRLEMADIAFWHQVRNIIVQMKPSV